MSITKIKLEALYRKYNRREYIYPDPLIFLYDYPDPADQEIVGLLASALAYGRVESILNSVSQALDRLGPHPARQVRGGDFQALRQCFRGFVHRFADGDKTAAMLAGAGRLLREYGSLYHCFAAGVQPDAPNLVPGTIAFCRKLTQGLPVDPGHLIPRPERGSACKRLHLFLRWMVRKDAVDPGGWEGLGRSRLIIPLDVHMHRVARQLGLTRRKGADLKTALEITAGFQRIAPADPVRYDFALTRPGIRREPKKEIASAPGILL